MKTTRITIAALALLAPTLHAASVSVDFNSLPTAQGWSYLGNIAQGSTFSLAGGTLTQNSLGTGGGFGYFQMPGIVDTSLPFSLSFRGRVLQDESLDTFNAASFGVQLNFDSQYFLIGLGSSRITSTSAGGGSVVSTSINTSQFHDYLFTGNPTDHTWQFFVDGTQIGTGLARTSVQANNLYWGDLTQGPNARGEWTQFAFAQVPEPSTVALAGLGVVGLLARFVFRRQRGD